MDATKENLIFSIEQSDHQRHSWKISQYTSDMLVGDVKKIILLSGSADGDQKFN